MKGEIRIKKINQFEMILGGIFFIPFISGFLVETFRFPYMINYVLDFLCLVALVIMYINRSRIRLGDEQVLVWWLLLFLVYTLLVQTFTYQSVFYYFWGLRNNFRFYIVFFAAISFLSQNMANNLIKAFDFIFWINAFVTFVQYFGFSISGDELGGIFGTEIRVNQYTNVLLAIVLIISVVRFLSKKENTGYSIAKLAVACFIAALAELKFFFVEVIVVLVCAVCITSFSWRKLGIMLLGSICVIIGSIILTSLFAEGNLASMSIKSLISIVTSDKGYTSSGDLNRLTAIRQINEIFFDEPIQRLFGFGLGNCDASSYDICNTPFYQEYSYLHYIWFSISMMYLETGYCGLSMFFAFYIVIFFLARKIMKRGKGNKEFCQIGMIMTVVCCMLAVYNSSLRIEAGYMIYFVIALPFIRSDDQKTNGLLEC